jgi:hypothetical protein
MYSRLPGGVEQLAAVSNVAANNIKIISFDMTWILLVFAAPASAIACILSHA